MKIIWAGIAAVVVEAVVVGIKEVLGVEMMEACGGKMCSRGSMPR